ncbi:MAG: cysteine--tRNA ligase [Streptosporangiales bacterium]|nr:cysteine--tRNA ligase [Streptosporangiales bacterium]
MLRLYDSRTRRVEEIVPARRGELRMYVCGPTVYRYAHVGNFRSYLFADLIRRAAERHRLRVTACQNITDVGHLEDDTDIDPHGEDKILAQARTEGVDAFELARRYEDAFWCDTQALNIRPPEHSPRASESIDLMIDLIGRLIESGHAYVAPDGSVFFDSRSFPSYGAISGNRLDDLRPGHRHEDSIDEKKRFHADWALWKAAGTKRQMTWESPWAVGYPGWHIECSAMSLHFLGTPIDVHTGGIDLRFPHHEDERAQSETAVGREVVRHWVHGEHLLFEGRKMAKSAGNVVLLSDLASRGLDPLALRLALMEHRYRQQMNLTWNDLHAADKTVRRWRARVADWAESPSRPMSSDHVQRIHEAVDDDLDTPTALRVLRELEKEPAVPAGAKFETFVYLDGILGLDLASDIGQPREAPALPEDAVGLIEERAAARSRRDWPASDRLRDELAAMGVKVIDTPEGQRWS